VYAEKHGYVVDHEDATEVEAEAGTGGMTVAGTEVKAEGVNAAGAGAGTEAKGGDGGGGEEKSLYDPSMPPLIPMSAKAKALTHAQAQEQEQEQGQGQQGQGQGHGHSRVPSTTLPPPQPQHHPQPLQQLHGADTQSRHHSHSQHLSLPRPTPPYWAPTPQLPPHAPNKVPAAYHALRPLLFVGNHQLLGSDSCLLQWVLNKHCGLYLRGLAHRGTFKKNYYSNYTNLE
jgi:hypothetical protein